MTRHGVTVAALRAIAKDLGPAWRVNRRLLWLQAPGLILIPHASGSWMCTASVRFEDLHIQRMGQSPVHALANARRAVEALRQGLQRRGEGMDKVMKGSV